MAAGRRGVERRAAVLRSRRREVRSEKGDASVKAAAVALRLGCVEGQQHAASVPPVAWVQKWRLIQRISTRAESAAPDAMRISSPATLETRTSTTDTWPFAHASMSGVFPPCGRGSKHDESQKGHCEACLLRECRRQSVCAGCPLLSHLIESCGCVGAGRIDDRLHALEVTLLGGLVQGRPPLVLGA